jgi:sugar/nucleoside kinase (ribokinase family)
MTLIDADRRAYLTSAVGAPHSRRTGGGSAGNTVVALAQLGGAGFYSCRVADDELGDFYRNDLHGYGVKSNLVSGSGVAGQTGTCMIMVTPDAERSMNTFLGATADIDATSLNAAAIAQSKIYYMEGYLAASPTGSDAAVKGRAIARQAGVQLACTLSDMTMINFCRPGLEAMVGNASTGTLDYLFTNEEEAQTWCGTKDLAAIVSHMAQLSRVVCLTRSAKGCIIIEGGQQSEVPAAKVTAVDTNGAGDMFAGAFLYAVTQGRTHAQAAWLANQAAGQVVSQFGNRLSNASMADLKRQFESHLA